MRPLLRLPSRGRQLLSRSFSQIGRNPSTLRKKKPHGSSRRLGGGSSDSHPAASTTTVGSVDDETDNEYRSDERDDDADDRDGAGDDVGEAVRSAKRRFSKLWGDQVRVGWGAKRLESRRDRDGSSEWIRVVTSRMPRLRPQDVLM